MNQKETLNKSIDELIDELFSEPKMEKSIGVGGGGWDMPAAEKRNPQSSLMSDGSDAGKGPKNAEEGEKPPKAKKDKPGDESGRPKQISDVPDEDEDGDRAKGYESIQSKNEATPDISAKGTMVKAEDKYEINKDEFELLQKAKKAQEDEVIKKAKTEQMDLIKSAITEATSGLRDENSKLQKALQETQDLVKAMAKKPQQQKSITSVQSIEKSFGGNSESSKPETFSKSEMLDAAESLYKAGEITLEQAIELDDTGSIFDQSARRKIMRKLGQ